MRPILVALAVAALVGCTANPPTPFYPQPTTGAIASPTAVALPSPTLSATVTQARASTPPVLTATAPKPEIISFTALPTTTTSLGENLLLTWQAKGEKAEVCGIVETGPIDCQPVPLAGNMTITTTRASLYYVALALRATAKDNSVISLAPVMLCADTTKWFFDRAPARCPQPADISRGAAQYFEHGTMVWIPKPDKFFVLYADSKQSFEMASAPYVFKPGASPNNRVGGAPNGLVEPVSGFGQVWRGEIVGMENARQRLGWAIASEFAFDAAYQCQFGNVRLWSCYLRDPRGQLLWLHPDSSAQVNLLWSVVSPK